MARYRDATGIYNIDEKDIGRFEQQFPNAVRLDNDYLLRKQEEEISAGEFFTDLATSVPQALLKTAGGVVNYLEAGERTLRDYIYRDLDEKEKAKRIADIEENGFSLLSKGNDNIFSNAGAYFDQFDIKADKSITEELDLTDPSTWGRAGARAVVAGIESWPSIAAAFLGAPAMIALGVSYAGNKFEEELAKDPTKGMGELLLNATGTGAIEAGFEMATRGLFKYAGIVGNQSGAAAAKEVLKGGFIEVSKKLSGGFVFEGASEAATELANNVWDSMTIEGREMPTIAQMKYQLGDAFLVGGLVGGTITGFGQINNKSKAVVDRANITLMPIEDKGQIQEKAQQIKKLYIDRSRAKRVKNNERVLQKIDTQITFLKSDIQRIQDKNLNALRNMSGEKLKDYATNVTEINTLIQEIKDNPGNSTVKNLNQENIRLLSEQNKNLRDESLQDITGKQFESVETLIQKAEEKGLKITVQKGDNDAMQKFAQERGQDADLKGSTKYGGFIPVFDKKGNITSLDLFINEKNSIKNGFLNTAAHEFFHAAIFSTLKQNINAQSSLGDALVRALKAKGATIKESSDLNERIASYTPEQGQGEEVLALIIEALKNNEININEGFVQGLRDAWRRFGQQYLGVEIRFDTDQDVLNFVKDYIKTIDNPAKLNDAMLGLITKGAEGKLLEVAEGEDAEVQAFSKEASDNVQQLYENRADNASFEFDIIEQFKPIVGKIVDKRKDAPNFDRQLLTDEIETGQRGILDLIREYKPESGVPLAAYINKFLPARAIEASRRVLGEEFTEDVTEARGVIAKETADVEVETTREQKETVVADRLGVSEQAAKTIEKVAPDLDFENLNYKTLKNQLPDIVSELFGINVLKLTPTDKKYLANLTKKETQTAQMFINKNADLLIALLPEGATASGTATGVPNSLLKAFYTKTDRAKATTTGSTAGLPIQQKNDIDREIFLETFGIINGKPDRSDRNISARILAIANVTGQVITNQTVRQNQKALGITQKAIDRIKDGKSKVMFSQAGIRKLATEAGLPVAPTNIKTKDRNSLKNFLVDFFGEQGIPLPGRLHRATYARGSKSKGNDFVVKNYYMSANEAAILAKKIQQKQLSRKKPFTKKEQALIEEVFRSKIDDFNKLGNNLELLKEGIAYYIKNWNKFINNDKVGNKRNLLEFEKLLQSSSVAKTHVMRMIAPALGKTNVGKISEKEHVFVQNKAGEFIFSALASDNVDLVLPWFIENYYMIGLSESQNALLKEYSQGMPEVFYENLQKAIKAGNMSLASDPLIRYTMSNINLSEISWHSGGNLLQHVDKKYSFGGILSYGNGNTTTVEQVNEVLTEFFAKRITLQQAKDQISVISNVNYTKDIKSTKVFNKAINKSRLVASKDARGITVLDFDDTLATSKSLVRYTAPGQTVVYNASPKSIKELGKRSGIIYLATDKKEADAYAKSNRGKVKEFVVDDANVVNENVVLKEMKDQGIDTSEGLLYEMIDSRFPDFYIGKKNVDKVFNALRKKGIKAFRYEDGSQISSKTTKSIAVIDKSAISQPGTLNAEQYASTYQDLQDQGYTFDFSEFNKVVGGKIAPLFQKALKLQGKFGPENMFVLTARPPQAQKAIYDFLKANGLNIPLKNITGLGNSTAEAKALWIADKVGEGYNDFYFADDALQNVQAVDNMLEQFDVKRKVQQAKMQFSKPADLDKIFNDIIQDVTGIEAQKRFERTKARKRGASKGRFRYFIPPSHEDFAGLLYNFMGKGKQGDKHRDFLEQALIRPLNRANREYDTARQSIATDYKNLNKKFPDIKQRLKDKTPDGDFIIEDAVRIYLWDKHGYDIPGLSPIDQKNLVELVNSDGKLKAYADAINIISKQDTYVNPTDGWESGDIRMDLDDATGRVGREQFFAEFIENADIIFSKENLNKIEAGYGSGVRSAIEDMLYRIKTGRNRPTGTNAQVNRFMNWLNGAVGSVMFFNIRSAVLQQMSLVNYINFADNNIFAAAKAFANQKQYWADWAFIFNSDMLKQRRGGIQTDINGAELAENISKSKYPARALIRQLLQIGFLPTQIGDNIAIATGGATYYRNRINKYLKDGLSKKEAEAKAFTDFQNITQSTQQSARPDMISQQQASVLGRLVLAFQNVTSQFNRLGKKAAQDIYNRRTTPPNSTLLQSDVSNTARIAYYFGIQNLIFYSLQTALFAAMFDDDEDQEFLTTKGQRSLNGALDSILRGMGVGGAVVSTLKNMGIKFLDERQKGYNFDESAVIGELTNFSPPIGIKIRKVVNAEKTLNWNKSLIEDMSKGDFDNPQWSAVTNYVEGLTNIPLNRLYNKTNNIRQSLNNNHEAWQRFLMFFGWSQYNLDIKNEEVEKAKEELKIKKQSKKRSSTKSKRKITKR